MHLFIFYLIIYLLYCLEGNLKKLMVKNFVNNSSCPGRVHTKEAWTNTNSKLGWVGKFIFDKQSIYEEIRRAVNRKIKILHIVYGV